MAVGAGAVEQRGTEAMTHPYREPGTVLSPPVVYEGDIWNVTTDVDKADLAMLGVDLLEETEPGCFHCRANGEVVAKLDGSWGRFGWSLVPTQLPGGGDER